MLTLLFLVLIVATQQEDAARLKFPTFEPFTSARMYTAVAMSSSADIDKLCGRLAEMAEELRAGEEALRELNGAQDDTCRLTPKLPHEQRVAAPLVPPALMLLHPLWGERPWTAEGVADASAVVQLLEHFPSAPQPAFAIGSDAENRRGLEAIVQWFNGQVQKPEWYASMISTLDEGPFVGLPYAGNGPCIIRESERLDETAEVRVCEAQGAGLCVLQLVKAGKTLWTRTISSPDGPVANLRFVEYAPYRVKAMGLYGWKLSLSAEWSGGDELCEVYVSAGGELLFYFLGW